MISSINYLYYLQKDPINRLNSILERLSIVIVNVFGDAVDIRINPQTP